jgi:hypothetical protein
VNQPLQRKNRLTGQSFGPASSEAQWLADADRVLKSGLSGVANAVGSIPEGYDRLMDAAPGNRWDPTLGGAQALGDLVPVQEGINTLGRGVNAGLDGVQQALLTGLDTAGSGLETADAALMDALRKAQSGYGTARREVGGFLGDAANTPIRNLRGIQDAVGTIQGGSEPPLENPGLSNLNLSDNDYIQMLMKKKDRTPAENEALTDYLTNGQINRLNEMMLPPEVSSGAYNPYGVGDAEQDLKDAIARKEAGTLVPERGGSSKSSSPDADGEMYGPGRPEYEKAIRNLEEQEAARMQALFDQMFPAGAQAEGGMGLAEQLADTNRGYAQGRYNDLTGFLDAERTRAGAQFDSDEEAIVKQLLGSDAKRRNAEDMYTARRGQSFNELERKLGARTGAASARLKNLGIDPAGYTDVVGQEMGALLGAQMQSGADLAERMAMLGAERAQLGIGRAKAGMAKERRAFDRNASDMLFQGSQRLSYELQDINEALMNRRISAAAASAAAANEARAQASRAMVIGQSFGMPGDVAAASSTFPGLLKEFAGMAADNDQGMAMTLTPEMLPDGFKHLADGQRTASLDQIIQFGKIAEQAALYG